MTLCRPLPLCRRLPLRHIRIAIVIILFSVFGGVLSPATGPTNRAPRSNPRTMLAAICRSRGCPRTSLYWFGIDQKHVWVSAASWCKTNKQTKNTEWPTWLLSPSLSPRRPPLPSPSRGGSCLSSVSPCAKLQRSPKRHSPFCHLRERRWINVRSCLGAREQRPTTIKIWSMNVYHTNAFDFTSCRSLFSRFRPCREILFSLGAL